MLYKSNKYKGYRKSEIKSVYFKYTSFKQCSLVPLCIIVLETYKQSIFKYLFWLRMHFITHLNEGFKENTPSFILYMLYLRKEKKYRCCLLAESRVFL